MAFEAALAHPVGDLLVTDRVILEPVWSGAGLGPVLGCAAIRRLAQGTALRWRAIRVPPWVAS